MPQSIKYYPEDVQDFGTIGILLPMNSRPDTTGDGVFATSRTTEDQAVSNYINLLLTKKGERYMQPQFGVGLPFKLFEPNTQIVQIEIEQEIRNQASFWLPYIINESIEVRNPKDILGLSGTDEDNAVQIIITFRVTESGANRTIVIFQSEGRTNIALS